MAFRNIYRNFNRNKPVYFILFFSFLILIVLNSIIFSIADSYQSLYINYLTSNFSISVNEQDFTIFGSSQLFIGNFVLPSIINNVERVVEILNNEESVQGWTGLLTIPALVSIPGKASIASIVFGVDFESYFEFFPDIQILKGSFPSADRSQYQVIIQQKYYEDIGSPDIGSPINIINSDEFGVRFRTAILSGIYSYPAEDRLLSNVILADANIVRSLSGYISEPQQLVDISDTEQELIFSEIDDLFNSTPESEDESELEINEIEQLLSNSQERQEAQSVVESAWHFLLISSNENYSFSESRRILYNYGLTTDNGYKISNWIDTAGGNAQLVYFLTLLINIGSGILVFGTLLIILNSLVLSILERSWEIATMRAIGASKMVIVKLISAEVFITIISTFLLGIIGGIFCITLINNFNLTPPNNLLNILFTNTGIQGIITIPLIISHFGLGLLIAILCTVYPLVRVLKISPNQFLS